MKSLRRKDRAAATDETLELLRSAEYGVLSTVGETGQPYGVPLSYVYLDEAIYFHSAKIGHKLDNIKHNNRICFTVIGKTNVLPGVFSTEYESVVVFGVATEVEGVERYNGLLAILEKYSPEYVEEGKKYIDQKNKATKVFKISIDSFCGKAKR
jgi:hypothetical protein